MITNIPTINQYQVLRMIVEGESLIDAMHADYLQKCPNASLEDFNNRVNALLPKNWTKLFEVDPLGYGSNFSFRGSSEHLSALSNIGNVLQAIDQYGVVFNFDIVLKVWQGTRAKDPYILQAITSFLGGMEIAEPYLYLLNTVTVRYYSDKEETDDEPLQLPTLEVCARDLDYEGLVVASLWQKFPPWLRNAYFRIYVGYPYDDTEHRHHPTFEDEHGESAEPRGVITDNVMAERMRQFLRNARSAYNKLWISSSKA